jgi:hypothetical protein
MEQPWQQIKIWLDLGLERDLLNWKELQPLKKQNQKKRQLTLFSQDNPQVRIWLTRFTAWFGKRYGAAPPEADPFKRATLKGYKALKETEGEAAWRPTSEMVQDQYHYKSFHQELGWLAQLATMDPEIIMRAGNAVMRNETMGWTEESGRKWYLAGTRSIYAWLSAAIRLTTQEKTLRILRTDALADEVQTMAADGGLDYNAALSAMGALAAGNHEGAVGILRSEGVEIDMIKAGLRGVLGGNGNGKNEVKYGTDKPNGHS